MQISALLALVLALVLALAPPASAALAVPGPRAPGAEPWAGADFAGPGPCGVAADTGIPITLPPESGCGSDCALEMHLTGPAAAAGPAGAANAANTACPFGAPYPVVFLYPGFQLRASFYEGYAERLASWGMAVVRYDIRVLDLVPAGVQAKYVEHLVPALEALSSDPASKWYQQLDLTRLAAAGHSRGGKLAALHLASQAPPLFSAAYLIDPVDSDGGAGDPSAVEALRGLGKSFGISAAGIVGSCNPEDRTRGFWEVAGAGSWRETLRRGGHVQFCNISSWVVERALDALCGRGDDSHVAVAQLTLPPMVAWLSKGLQPPPQQQPQQQQQQQQQQQPLQDGPWAGPRPAAAGAASSPAGRGADGKLSRSGALLWRHGLRQAGLALPAARRLLAAGTPAPRAVREARGQGPAAAAAGEGLGGAFWDWVRRERELGEIEFETK